MSSDAHSPELVLMYWNMPFWRAEVARLALHLGGVPFEDRRVSREEFRELQAEGRLPFGQLPVLWVNGRPIPQTHAIARYCGVLSGLYPVDDLIEAAVVDATIAAATDITVAMGPSMRERDADKKAKLRAQLNDETLPIALGRLESWLAAAGSSGYFADGRLTVADLAVWRLLGWLTSGMLDAISSDLLRPHERLRAHFNRVDAEPRVRAWMSERYGA